ncbi:hypothetical protein BC629DRAFT_1598965 [Irpex lacteus]|nr:hypothetical protein BC629DRAFT_1598965 [Irpex lacteus]
MATLPNPSEYIVSPTTEHDGFENHHCSPSTAPGSDFSSSGYSDRGVTFTPEPSTSPHTSPFPFAVSFGDSSHQWPPENAFNGKLDYNDYGRRQNPMRPPTLFPHATPTRGTPSSTPDPSLTNISRQLGFIIGRLQSLESSMETIRVNQTALMVRFEDVEGQRAGNLPRALAALPLIAAEGLFKLSLSE